jgi:plasmid replication initiation protein
MSNHLPQVIKSNFLVQASYRLSLIEQRILLSAITQIRNSEKITDEVLYKVRAEDLVSLGSDEKDAYARLKEAAQKLFERKITLIYEVKNGISTKKIKSNIRWIQRADYLDSEGCLEIRFSKDILPYINNLEEQFTQYDLKDIASITSSHAIRVYELLMQWGSTGKREVSLENFKNMLQIEDQYKSIKDLKTRVLLPAIDQINEFTPLKVSWTQKKTGRKITHFLFSFERKDGKPIQTKNKKLKTNDDIAHLARPGETWEDLKKRLKQETTQ